MDHLTSSIQEVCMQTWQVFAEPVTYMYVLVFSEFLQTGCKKIVTF